MEQDKKDTSFMIKLATLIVDKRKGFFLIFIVLIIYSILSMNKVKVNNDLTLYLPETTETRQGMDLMNEQFITYGTARIMVCNITYDEAEQLSEDIKGMEGVTMVDFDDSEEHYHDMEALYSVTFDGEAKEDTTTAETKAVAAVALSPMLRQFLDLKQKHPDALLLFRTGDFYETYKQDAEKASKILGITLTKSSKTKDEQGKPLVMAGFPYHALDTSLPKLIRAGQRVAICDQLEAPKQTAKRGISELVSPGAAAEKEQKAEPEKQQSFHR